MASSLPPPPPPPPGHRLSVPPSAVAPPIDMAAALAEKLGQLKTTETVVRQVDSGWGGATEGANLLGNGRECLYTDEELLRMKDEHFSTNMDAVLNKLPERCSFPLTTITLTTAHAEALLVHHVKRHEPWQTRHSWMDMTSEDAAAIRRELEVIIDAEIARLKENHGTGCFVKLSCRSAKDVTPPLEKLRAHVVSALLTPADDNHGVSPQGLATAASLRYGPTSDQNARICALYEASLQSLRVESAAEALALFQQSARISFDLELDLRFPQNFSTSIILRPWVEIPLVSEFRGFVHDGVMTALSQYYTQCYFAELASVSDAVLARVTSFWRDSIREVVAANGLASYVIDFVVLPSRVLVLELNPFNVSTGIEF